MALTTDSTALWSDIRALFNRVNAERNRWGQSTTTPSPGQGGKILASTINTDLKSNVESLTEISFLSSAASTSGVSSVSRGSVITPPALTGLQGVLSKVESTFGICSGFGCSSFKSAHCSSGFTAAVPARNTTFGAANTSFTFKSAHCSSGFTEARNTTFGAAYGTYYSFLYFVTFFSAGFGAGCSANFDFNSTFAYNGTYYSFSFTSESGFTFNFTCFTFTFSPNSGFGFCAASFKSAVGFDYNGTFSGGQSFCSGFGFDGSFGFCAASFNSSHCSSFTEARNTTFGAANTSFTFQSAHCSDFTAFRAAVNGTFGAHFASGFNSAYKIAGFCSSGFNAATFFNNL